MVRSWPLYRGTEQHAGRCLHSRYIGSCQCCCNWLLRLRGCSLLLCCPDRWRRWSRRLSRSSLLLCCLRLLSSLLLGSLLQRCFLRCFGCSGGICLPVGSMLLGYRHSSLLHNCLVCSERGSVGCLLLGRGRLCSLACGYHRGGWRVCPWRQDRLSSLLDVICEGDTRYASSGCGCSIATIGTCCLLGHGRRVLTLSCHLFGHGRRVLTRSGGC